MFLRKKITLGILISLPLFFRSECTFAQNTREYFLKDLERVDIVMSKSEIEEIMSKYVKGTNWPYSDAPSMDIIGSKRETYELDNSKKDQLSLKNCDVYRHSDDPQFDSDWGIICYKNEKVDWIDFAPD